MKFWVARDRDGELFAYQRKPQKLSTKWFCKGKTAYLSDKFFDLFKDLTCESDPVEVELKVVEKMCENCEKIFKTPLAKPSYEELEAKIKELQDVLILAAQLTVDNFVNPRISISVSGLIDYWFEKCKEARNEN